MHSFAEPPLSYVTKTFGPAQSPTMDRRLLRLKPLTDPQILRRRQKFLRLISPTDSEACSGLGLLARQMENRKRLLLEALLSSKDWKVRLVLQYELDTVLRHYEVLRQMIGRDGRP